MLQELNACATCGAPIPVTEAECPRCRWFELDGNADWEAALGTDEPACRLTERDVRLLEQAADINGGQATAIGRAVAAKLRAASVELCEAIPAGYVTLGSRVVFRVNGGQPLSRVLVHWDRFSVPGLDLSLATPWGITLLGMRIGSEAPAYWRDGSAEWIRVDAIPYRPKQPTMPATAGRGASGRSAVASLHTARLRRASSALHRSSPTDDPGPAAA